MSILSIRQVEYSTKKKEGYDLDNSYGRKNYMDYWHFSDDEKNQLTKKLTEELPALRGAVKASQDEIANAIGVSRFFPEAGRKKRRKDARRRFSDGLPRAEKSRVEVPRKSSSHLYDFSEAQIQVSNRKNTRKIFETG